jgi:sugar phosphate isomerase/epimerase
LIPLAGWLADPNKPEESRAKRLATIRQLVAGYGLSALELTTDLSFIYPHIFDTSFYSAVADLQQELGFACSVHLPFLWVDPASLNESLRQASVQCLRRALELTQPVEVATYVVHLWGLTGTQISTVLNRPEERQVVVGALMAQAERSLGEICANIDPHTLCVENLEDRLFEAAVPLIAKHGARICLDVGHLAWQDVDAVQFLERHGNRVREVHLHDATRVPGPGPPAIRDHLALGQGQIDYEAVIQKLEEIGFEGLVILENHNRADLEQSLAGLESLSPRDGSSAVH